MNSAGQSHAARSLGVLRVPRPIGDRALAVHSGVNALDISNRIVTQMLSACPRRRYSSTVEGQPCSIHLLK